MSERENGKYDGKPKPDEVKEQASGFGGQTTNKGHTENGNKGSGKKRK